MLKSPAKKRELNPSLQGVYLYRYDRRLNSSLLELPLLRRLITSTLGHLLRFDSGNALDEYIQGAPNDQNAIDIFKGEWSSQFPGAWKKLKAGTITLFDDARIAWAADQLGGFNGQRVIELGPLEAGHTYMLESLGAESVLAVEANKRAYLKCLITKEILGLHRSHFMLGDVVSFLRDNIRSSMSASRAESSITCKTLANLFT